MSRVGSAVFTPQATYQLWNGLENSGPGPAKYMMPSDFGNVESMLPKSIDISLNGQIPKHRARRSSAT